MLPQEGTWVLFVDFLAVSTKTVVGAQGGEFVSKAGAEQEESEYNIFPQSPIFKRESFRVKSLEG